MNKRTQNHLRLVEPSTIEAKSEKRTMPWWQKTAGALAITGTALVGFNAAEKALEEHDIYQESDKTTEYVVKSGDTTWNIAKKLDKELDGISGNMDTRSIVANIEKHNPSIEDMGRINSGDTLILPDFSEQDSNA